jgi:hypothetical protein
MHVLQCEPSLGWDVKLSDLQLKEWKNISRQANASPVFEIERFVGRRDGRYKLICFTDASKSIYGTVIYIQDLDSLKVSFLSAKNRMVSKNLKTKSIPCLEFQAIILGIEVMMDLYMEFTGKSSLVPLQIEKLQLFSDSMVSLNWINAHCNKFDKTQQKRTVFITNRLNTLTKLCERFPVKFNFCSGFENPADQISRPISAKQLARSNYFTGPEFLKDGSNSDFGKEDILEIIVPNPLISTQTLLETSQFQGIVNNSSSDEPMDHLIPLNRFSSFHKLINVHINVLKFVNNLKLKLISKNPDKFKHFSFLDPDEIFFVIARNHIIRRDQQLEFDECFQYFALPIKTIKSLPNIVGQLNVYPDKDNLLRVRSKCSRGSDKHKTYFPLLLSKKSLLTKLITLNLHKELNHVGCYTLLHELRKRFWIPQVFSFVKSILKDCIVCKRLNSHTIKLNQSPYRQFRINPPCIPFKFVFLDHLGPYTVKMDGKNVKVWLLCFTCLWSRAINLQICLDLTTDCFLRAFQLHCFEFGLPELVLSDLGSQIVSASHIITDYLKDTETQLFFKEHNVNSTTFDQYYKGNSSLGSLVESCVKLVKRIIYGSIKNLILKYFDFEFVIKNTIHLANRRPIAFKESLRSNDPNDLPDPITPELLLKGHELVSINIIPGLQSDPEPDPTWNLHPIDKAKSSYDSLKKVRNRLIEIYNEEFLSTLMIQATNKKDRYKPVNNKLLGKGDIVLLKEKHLKPSNYPMGIVKDIQRNVQNEVTGVTVLKGKTNEVVKRHVNSLIPLMSLSAENDLDKLNSTTQKDLTQVLTTQEEVVNKVRSSRVAAIKCSRVNEQLSRQDLV